MEAAIVFIIIGLAGGNGHLGPNGVTPPFDVNHVINQVSHQQMTGGEFLLDTNVVYVPAIGDQAYPSVAFDGTNYLVVWGDYRDGFPSHIYGTRVNQNGVVLDPLGIAISTAGGDTASQDCPSLAFDGTNYFVVWEDCRGFYGIYGARVNREGIVLDTVAITLPLVGCGMGWAPSIAFDGKNYFVVESNGKIYGVRVNPAGKVLDSKGIVLSTASDDQKQPFVAFDGKNYLAVWQDGHSGYIYGCRVTQAGVVLDPSDFVISSFPILGTEVSPAVTFGDTNYLVVWPDNRDQSGWLIYNFYGARVNQNGNVLDPSGIKIFDKTSESGSRPSIAFDGKNFLVVASCGNLYGARVNPAGLPLDYAGFAISAGAGMPSIAFDGTNYLVVWGDRRNGNSDIYGARVTPSGMVLDSNGIAMATVCYEQDSPSIAFDGANYFVAWQDRRRGSGSDIYGARVNEAGSVIDSSDITIGVASYGGVHPSVAFGGLNYLVSWQNDGICGAQISQTGKILDTLCIALSPEEGLDWAQYPSVASDGTDFLVVWQDSRSTPGSYIAPHYDIYGARVNHAGTVLDPSGIAISTSLEENYGHRYPSITFGKTDYLVVWYWGWTDVIYGALVSPIGEVSKTRFSISQTIAQGFPVGAFDGTNFFVVWERGGSSDIYGARVNQQGAVLDTAGILISAGMHMQSGLSVTFDGTNYVVVWQDNRNGDWDIYGAKVNSSGKVIKTFPICVQPGDQIEPKVVRGTDGQALIVWSGWTPEINGKPTNTMRIWGKFYSSTGVGEDAGRRTQEAVNALTITPSVFSAHATIRYSLSGVGNERQGVKLKIYDSSGRVVREFNHLTNYLFNQLAWDGADDSRRVLPAGVYFCRLETGTAKITKKIVKLK